MSAVANPPCYDFMALSKKSRRTAGILALMGTAVTIAGLIAAFTGHLATIVTNAKQVFTPESGEQVPLDRLQRGDDSIIVQATECTGTFRIEGWLKLKGTEEKIWQVHVSDVLESGPRPVPPTAPNPKKITGFAYLGAKKVYDDKTAAYKKAVAKWQQDFGRNLDDNGIDLSPKLIERGLYTLKLIIVPEIETNQTWKIRLVTRLESKDRKAKQFKVISIEKRDFPNHTLGTALPAESSFFNVR